MSERRRDERQDEAGVEHRAGQRLDDVRRQGRRPVGRGFEPLRHAGWFAGYGCLIVVRVGGGGGWTTKGSRASRGRQGRSMGDERSKDEPISQLLLPTNPAPSIRARRVAFLSSGEGVPVVRAVRRASAVGCRPVGRVEAGAHEFDPGEVWHSGESWE
eukprot:1738358-Pyramimonas_sp.AAC.1